MSSTAMNTMAMLYPEGVADQAGIDQQRALAQAILSQGLQPMQSNAMAGNVAYHVSPMEGLAKMLQTGVGMQMQGDANQQAAALAVRQRDALSSMFGGKQQAQGQSPQPTDSDNQQALASVPANGGPAGPTNKAALLAQAIAQQGQQQQPAAQAQQPAAPGQPPAQSGGFSLPGMTPQQSMAAYLMNPNKYMETYLTQYKAPDLVAKLRAAGVDPSSALGRQLMQDSIDKDNYIAPVSMRPGGAVMDPRTGQITTMPAGAPDGFQNVQTADGRWVTVPVTGGTAAVQQSAQAKAAGNAAVKPMTAYDANGNPVFTNELTAAQGGAGGQQGGRFAGYSQPGQPATTGQLRPQPLAGTNSSREAIAQSNAKKYSDLTSTAADSPTRVNVLDNIIQLSQNGVNTGPGSAWQNKVLGFAANSPVLGSLVAGKKDSVAQFQEMQKYLAQNGLRQWQAAGGTGTDSQLNAAMHANPNDAHFPQALQALAKWNKAGEMALQAKANAASKYMAANGNDATQYNQFENTWRQNFDPRIAQMQLMQPQELQQFVKGLQPADRATLLKKYQFVKQQGWM
jgi:hypothetical protein